MLDISLTRIPLEQKIGKELFDLMQGDLLEEILTEGKIGKLENGWKYIFEGHSFKSSPELSPSLHQLFTEVTGKLSFTEPVEFFITNSPEFNACSLSSLEPDDPHIVSLNAALVDRLDNDELKFVIGHEIGHLITKNARIMRLINMVFPASNRTPIILSHKIDLWQKISELTSDRFGFIASPNLEKCVSGFFKMASGLGPERINFNYKAYLDENDRILDFFRKNNAGNLTSHPINPIRIKAIRLFAESGSYKAICSGMPLEFDEQLTEQIEDLCNILMVLSNSEVDHHRKHFIAAAGLFMAHTDNDMAREEYEAILHELSDFTIFPSEFLLAIAKSGNLKDILEQSAKNLLNICPADRFPMFDTLLKITFADKLLAREEIAFLYQFGSEVLGFGRKEIAQMMAEGIQKRFIPKLYS